MRDVDVIIVGAGLAGLRASLECAETCSIIVLSKVHPTRSPSVAAQGGIAAALAPGDSWERHAADTLTCSQGLGDHDAIETMAKDAPAILLELDSWGALFSRTPDGRPAQRPFGGAGVPRACFAGDRTGHALLSTLYEQCQRQRVPILSEWLAVKLIYEDGRVKGVVAYELATGQLEVFRAKAVLLATGGCGRAFAATSNAHTSTGDGLALAYAEGLPLQDMEFVEFGLGLAGPGILLPEGLLSEGAALLNASQERFMARYAPQRMEGASLPLVISAIQTEIREGRGAGPHHDHVWLDLRHLGRERLASRLVPFSNLLLSSAGLDCATDLVPVRPAAHSAIGGIPTLVSGQAVADAATTPIPGLFAAGECACISVHGAKRLGGNALLEALVFGRRAGQAMRHAAERDPLPSIHRDALAEAQTVLRDLLTCDGPERVAVLRADLQATMTAHCGPVRSGSDMRVALARIRALQERFRRIRLDDKSRVYNTELAEALECQSLLTVSEAIAASALARTETRGAHVRADCPAREDARWLAHTLAAKGPTGPAVVMKPIVPTVPLPTERFP